MLNHNQNLYYGAGLRRRRTVRRRRHGAGFLDALRSAHDFIKQHKIISTVGKALGTVGVPYASSIGNAASALGYGRRRRRVPRRRVVHRRGGNIKSILSSAHKFIKDKKLVSSALSHFGHAKLANAASSLGYGRRRRRVIRRRRGGDLKSLLSHAHKFIKDKKLVSGALSHFGHSKLASAASALGYGRRRRRVVHRRIRHRGGANFFSTEQIAVPKF